MLMRFCYRLASTCNFADESPNDVDETRKQAKLLMNLMHSNSAAHCIDVDRNSSLERSISDQSFTSHHSEHSTKNRDRFSFTCPSLSLESSTSSFHDVEREVSAMHSHVAEADRLSRPAHLLLGRSLKVDDPDAIRLSADAMARNVLQSFQKAMYWRIHAWIYVLSKKLVEYEHQMLASGATIEDLKILLQTPEALLIVALQKLVQDRGLTAESAITTFEVLSQRIEDYEEEANRRSRVSSGSTGSTSSNGSTVSSDEITSLSDHSTDTLGSHSSEAYSYVVAHKLRFSCTVHLQTLVGFTEIAITVPGTVAGSFTSSELDPTAQFKSVKVDLDTNVLASLIDKACRAIVRSSVEKVITQPAEAKSMEESLVNHEDIKAVNKDTETAMTPKIPSFTLTSPPASTANLDRTPASSSAFVTPGPNHSDDLYHAPSASANVLIPIPDDLKGDTGSENDLPRRISPQPTTSRIRDFVRTGSTNSDDSSSFVNFPIVCTPSSSLKRRTPPVLNLEDGNDFDSSTSKSDQSSASKVNSRVQFLRQRRSLPLISPPMSQSTTKVFHNVPENGPSLPMLVEAACQVATSSGVNVDTDSTFNA